MARKKKPEEHVNHERWLVSYADFITLLFATFTALYAISNADKEKFADMAHSKVQLQLVSHISFLILAAFSVASIAGTS